ncbi:hypothetical protein EV126DRAFT_208008 [Verticillium dahliae]|nr:hypothetical protein EV126DRAFT_208008 [Verticillium dahliae]
MHLPTHTSLPTVENPETSQVQPCTSLPRPCSSHAMPHTLPRHRDAPQPGETEKEKNKKNEPAGSNGLETEARPGRIPLFLFFAVLFVCPLFGTVLVTSYQLDIPTWQVIVTYNRHLHDALQPSTEVLQSLPHLSSRVEPDPTRHHETSPPKRRCSADCHCLLRCRLARRAIRIWRQILLGRPRRGLALPAGRAGL